MIYVLQVRSGTESEVVTFMDETVEKGIYDDAYYPTRVMQKKYRGKWTEVKEKLIPGYVFVETTDPSGLYMQLKKVPRLTKLLGREDEGNAGIQKLSERDERWLLKMMGGREGQYMDPKLRGEVGLTLVSVDDENKVHILEGPLQGLEGNILRYNLHRRYADVEMEFMGQRTVLHMGIVITDRD